LTVPVTTVRRISGQWVGHLARFRHHANDEHREALIAEALRYIGFRLESELANSVYWRDIPLARCATVLLLLVDRGVVRRTQRNGRTLFEAVDDAESWASSQPTLLPYLAPTLELIAALRTAQARLPQSSN
jgi:hypothetical protein